METIENAQKSKDGTGACTVTLRLVGGWLTKTIEDLDKLLKEIFQDKSSILQRFLRFLQNLIRRP